jgi:hypothetical protein
MPAGVKIRAVVHDGSQLFSVPEHAPAERAQLQVGLRGQEGFGNGKELVDRAHRRGTIGISTARVNGQLTGRDSPVERSFYRSMLEDILIRIERRLQALNLNPSQASRRAGLGVDAIRNMQRAMKTPEGRKGVSTRTIAALAPVLQTSTAWLLEGEGPENLQVVPRAVIVGRVGKQDSGLVEMAGPGQDFGTVEPALGTIPQSDALAVTGHALGRFAEDGSILYFSNARAKPSSEMLGHVVVLAIDTGEVFIKRLLRGSTDSTWDLESLNGPTLSDAKVIWASTITAILPPLAITQLTRRPGAAA